MTASDHTSAARQGAPAPPPMRPDPALIGNIEGNVRERDEDRAAAVAYLREAGLAAPTAAGEESSARKAG